MYYNQNDLLSYSFNLKDLYQSIISEQVFKNNEIYNKIISKKPSGNPDIRITHNSFIYSLLSTEILNVLNIKESKLLFSGTEKKYNDTLTHKLFEYDCNINQKTRKKIIEIAKQMIKTSQYLEDLYSNIDSFIQMLSVIGQDNRIKVLLFDSIQKHNDIIAILNYFTHFYPNNFSERILNFNNLTTKVLWLFLYALLQKDIFLLFDCKTSILPMQSDKLFYIIQNYNLNYMNITQKTDDFLIPSISITSKEDTNKILLLKEAQIEFVKIIIDISQQYIKNEKINYPSYLTTFDSLKILLDKAKYPLLIDCKKLSEFPFELLSIEQMISITYDNSLFKLKDFNYITTQLIKTNSLMLCILDYSIYGISLIDKIEAYLNYHKNSNIKIVLTSSLLSFIDNIFFRKANYSIIEIKYSKKDIINWLMQKYPNEKQTIKFISGHFLFSDFFYNSQLIRILFEVGKSCDFNCYSTIETLIDVIIENSNYKLLSKTEIKLLLAKLIIDHGTSIDKDMICNYLTNGYLFNCNMLQFKPALSNNYFINNGNNFIEKFHFLGINNEGYFYEFNNPTIVSYLCTFFIIYSCQFKAFDIIISHDKFISNLPFSCRGKTIALISHANYIKNLNIDIHDIIKSLLLLMIEESVQEDVVDEFLKNSHLWKITSKDINLIEKLKLFNIQTK